MKSFPSSPTPSGFLSNASGHNSLDLAARDNTAATGKAREPIPRRSDARLPPVSPAPAAIAAGASKSAPGAASKGAPGASMGGPGAGKGAPGLPSSGSAGAQLDARDALRANGAGNRPEPRQALKRLRSFVAAWPRANLAGTLLAGALLGGVVLAVGAPRDTTVQPKGLFGITPNARPAKKAVPAARTVPAVRTVPAAPAVRAVPATTAAPAVQPQSLPVSLEQAVYLIRSTLLTLNDANRSGNYTVMRDLAAPDFQARNTAADLAQSFSDLRARNFDLYGAALLGPQLAAPTLDQDGMLHLAGYLPMQPLQINFDLTFQVVAGQWRLFAISVATPEPALTQPPAQAQPPGAPANPAPAARRS